MTDPLCGARHHHYPDTLCTEPAGHYVRDRDPHAGPLIIDGRERGGAAWDEPEEQPVTDRTTPDEQAAEDTVTRVIALYEQWVKAGPPPLGTPVSRWWDTRLAELHAAILPPDEPAQDSS